MDKKRLMVLSLVVSILILGIKFTAYFYTHSNAILTDAVESIVMLRRGLLLCLVFIMPANLQIRIILMVTA